MAHEVMAREEELQEEEVLNLIGQLSHASRVRPHNSSAHD